MKLLQWIFVLSLQTYRWFLSPLKSSLFGPLGRCRFVPSCSQYALEAVEAHGVWRGMGLAIGRLCRCHPWGGCGHDPVPCAHNPSTPSSRSLAGRIAPPRIHRSFFGSSRRTKG